MKTDRIKANGVHYTPPELATFLADVTVQHLPNSKDQIRVLDPACGDGALLQAFIQAMPSRSRKRLVLTGFETDEQAICNARQLLADSGAADVDLQMGDFLLVEGVESTQQTLFDPQEGRRYDAVIANPPYVRTQVLGARKAQLLAQRFGLTGRVDLYQAFTTAMANVLKPGGVLGLLTSNRFLTIKAGEALRRLLRTEFDLRAVYDLGDTRLFSAAVLPVIVVASKRDGSPLDEPCSFDRVYEHKPNGAAEVAEYPTVLRALEDRSVQGMVKTETGHFKIERGVLAPPQKSDGVWTLSTRAYDDWLRIVRAHQQHRFEDVAKVRVGIKTTADAVFVRADWRELPTEQRPEPVLLHPLITHHETRRWTITWTGRNKHVLYPHTVRNGKRAPIKLEDFPQAAAYIHAHAERLKRRKYVVESGREWYEIWVPHHPHDWSKPKIVFPDISETPKFCWDESGAIVQGDCYWMTLRSGFDPDWLLLMLAVANSAFITKFYDIAFHNKLYAGRRRFMTQYVKEFPLPPLTAAPSQKIVKAAKRLAQGKAVTAGAEAELNKLVWQAFGLGCV